MEQKPHVANLAAWTPARAPQVLWVEVAIHWPELSNPGDQIRAHLSLGLSRERLPPDKAREGDSPMQSRSCGQLQGVGH